MLELETYKGIKTRHTCPACGQSRVFVRYVDETGNYISDDVGRCNRDAKCGYHYKPKQFFADNPNCSNFGQIRRKTGTYSQAFNNKNGLQVNYEAKILTQKPDYIDHDVLLKILGNYEENAFVQFLLNLFNSFADDKETVLKAVKKYYVGTFPHYAGAYTCFPYIDQQKQITRGKLIRFNPETGKRLKGQFDTSSLSAILKLKENFQYKQIFFGEHLLQIEKDKPVGIVEAEKTAVIASICFPEFVWLACGSKQSLKADKLKRLGERQVILYPDADGFNQWQEVAKESIRNGLTVKVSSLIENHATDQQKADGYDLADYLINEQKELARQLSNNAINQTDTLRVEVESQKLHIILNQMIERGATFDVGPTNFQIIDTNKNLTQSDYEFLTSQNAEILNHLQQTLLKKFIFNDCQELFEDFAFQIKEREAIALENGASEIEAYNLATNSATNEWFADTIAEINNIS